MLNLAILESAFFNFSFSTEELTMQNLHQGHHHLHGFRPSSGLLLMWKRTHSSLSEMDRERTLHEGSTGTAKPSNNSFAKRTIDVRHGSFQSLLLQIQTEEKAWKISTLRNKQKKGMMIEEHQSQPASWVIILSLDLVTDNNEIAISVWN